jgi:hypothetical protein
VASALHPSPSTATRPSRLWAQAKRLLYVGLGPVSSLWQGFVSARRKKQKDREAKYRHRARIDLRLLEGRNAPGNPVNPLMFVGAGLGALAFIDQSILNPPMAAADEPPTTGSTPRLLREPATPGRDAAAGLAPVAEFARIRRDDDRILANSATEPVPAAGPQPSAELSDEAMLARFFAPWRDAPFDPGTGGGKGGVVTPGGPGAAYGTTGAPVAGGYASAPTLSADTTPVPFLSSGNPGGGPGSPATAAGPGGAAGAGGAAPAQSGGASAAGVNLSAQALLGSVPVPLSVTPDQVAQALGQYGQTPLRFEANRGQTDPPVAFLMHGQGQTLYLTPQQAVLDLHQFTPGAAGQPGTVSGTVLRTTFAGANPHPTVVGIDPLPGYTNYFDSPDPSKWVANVQSYAGVVYQDLYPGVDLVYYGNAQNQLEYDLVVSPGAIPDNIRFNVAGAQGVQVTPQGALVIHTAQGDVTEQAPRVYQTVPAGQQTVTAAFEMTTGGGVGFSVGPYDPRLPLVIDPTLSYSSYLGGSTAGGGTGNDQANSVAVDAQGDAYLVGTTGSKDFPTTTGAYQTSNDGGSDAFISKFNAAGTQLIYSTYLGGIGSDLGNTIAVDRLGNAYVTGQAAQGASSHFPTTANAYQNSTNQGEPWAFMTELSPTGNSLVYSSLLGGIGSSGSDEGYGIAVDGSGNVYVAGSTSDTNFPTTSGAWQTSHQGGTDGFVAKFNPSLSGSSSLVYSTYLGGSQTDVARAVAVDGSGNAYVAGYTKSTNFPTASAYQSSLPGTATQDAFLVKLNSAGSAESYGTYLGGAAGNSTSAGYGLALDGSNDAYVAGGTGAGDFPTTSGVYQSTNAGGTDAFVSKFDPTQSGGASLLYSTYLGGGNYDTGYAVAVDSTGDAYVAGNTGSTNFPTAKAIYSSNGGGTDAFVTKLVAGATALAYSTYLGVSSTDDGYGIALDGLSNAYVAGDTQSTNFPTSTGAYQTSNAGQDDAFISKITSWGATAQVLSTDPVQGDMESFGDAMLSPQTGDLQLTNPLSFTQSAGSSGTDSSAGLGGSPALVYNSDAANVLPIVQATLQSDYADGVPTSIQAQLTWDGTAQGWVTFATTNHSRGDTYAVALQANSAVTTMRMVSWQIEVKANLSGGGTVDLTNSGTALVPGIGTSQAFGAGWSLAGLDRIVNGTSGVMFVYGAGEARYFQGVSGTSNYTSPLNDFGTLTGSSTAGWTYTAKDQSKEYFNTAGYETAITDPDGQTVSYSYSTGNKPTLIQEPDGGLTTISYSAGNATLIQEPGGRSLTLT